MSEFARRLFDNAMLTLASRLAMLLASLFLPVVGFLGAFAFNRAVSSFDDLGRKVDATREETIDKIDRLTFDVADTNGRLKLVQQAQSVQNQMVADHEARMRFLENQNRIRAIP